MGELGQAWTAVVAVLGGDPAQAASSADDAERRYSAPTRGYHGTAHVLAVLRDIAILAPAVGLGPVERACVDAAAVAHDVVYDAVPGQDEQRSADWAKRALMDAGVPAAAAARVRELVLATASHEAPEGDAGAAVLLDADLAILASGPSGPSGYASYVAAVRAEYGHLADPQWAAGRSAVLASLLGRDALFSTAAGRERWESAARANMADELSGLVELASEPNKSD